MTGLGSPPSTARAISADGSVIVGHARPGGDREAVRWDNGTLTGLGHLPGGISTDSRVGDVSGDGSVIVGISSSAFGEDGEEAFIWDSHSGMRSLTSVLVELGLDLSGWTLRNATGISDDGQVVVGFGVNPAGFREGWIAVVPFSVFDNDGDGVNDGIDNCVNEPNFDQADADGDGIGDACNDAEDLDGDDWADALDNCPDDFDTSQSDQDEDGLGDVCDPFPNDPDNNLAQCSSDLGDCQIDLISCESDAAQCSTDLSQAQAAVITCNGDLSSCIGTATQLEADLLQTEGDLGQTQADLSQAQSDITLLQADVTQLELALTSTEAELTVATADTDGDGIRDTADGCPGTTVGAAVDLVGCSQAQFCSEIDVSTGPGRGTCNNSDWMNDEPRAENPEDCKATQGVCAALSSG